MALARIVGIVDKRGYLYCYACVTNNRYGERYGVDLEVYSDNRAHNSDHCDACGKRLDAIEDTPLEAVAYLQRFLPTYYAGLYAALAHKMYLDRNATAGAIVGGTYAIVPACLTRALTYPRGLTPLFQIAKSFGTALAV